MQRKGAHQPECKQNIDSVGFSVSSVVGVVSEIIIVVGACGDVCLCKKRTNEQDGSNIPETGDVGFEAGTPQESKKQEKSSKDGAMSSTEAAEEGNSFPSNTENS